MPSVISFTVSVKLFTFLNINDKKSQKYFPTTVATTVIMIDFTFINYIAINIIITTGAAGSTNVGVIAGMIGTIVVVVFYKK